MKFFFPDSQDQIDPTFDFVDEDRDLRRVRQRDDLYAHEVLAPPPFHGILVSKSIVDGYSDGSAGKYTGPQRLRLYREGAREFFRLDHAHGRLQIIGDCGAFTYVKAPLPPYSVDDVIDFYDGCGFNFGISVDHVIFQYEALAGRDDERAAEWVRRQEITLTLADEFWRRCRSRNVGFTPFGVAQGWSPDSYAYAVSALQRIGFRRIAMGGMVPMKTHEILACLRAVDDLREPDTQLHLLGVTRIKDIPTFAEHGVTSFDSTSPFRQAFKDDRDNYYTPNSTYVALRVPQVEGNVKLRKRIESGEIDQRVAITRERAALRLLRGFDAGVATLEDALAALQDYSEIWDGKRDRSAAYRRTLQDRPWLDCSCPLCKELGIEIAVFRGTERNKRRGFHNLHVFSGRLRNHLGEDLT